MNTLHPLLGPLAPYDALGRALVESIDAGCGLAAPQALVDLNARAHTLAGSACVDPNAIGSLCALDPLCAEKPLPCPHHATPHPQPEPEPQCDECGGTGMSNIIDDDGALVCGDVCHTCEDRAASPQPAPGEAVRQAWRAAITLANNICAQESDRENDADGNVGWIDGTAECAKRIRAYVEPTYDELLEMLQENGATAAIAALQQRRVPDASIIKSIRDGVVSLRNALEMIASDDAGDGYMNLAEESVIEANGVMPMQTNKIRIFPLRIMRLWLEFAPRNSGENVRSQSNRIKCLRAATGELYSVGVATTPFHRHASHRAPLPPQAGHQLKRQRIRWRWWPPHSHSTPGVVSVPAACSPGPNFPQPSHTLAGMARRGGTVKSLRGGRSRAMGRSVRGPAAPGETPVVATYRANGGCADSGHHEDPATGGSPQWEHIAPRRRNSEIQLDLRARILSSRSCNSLGKVTDERGNVPSLPDGIWVEG